MCAHIQSTLWVSTSYIVLMATNTLEPMMQFTTSLPPLCEMLASAWDENNLTTFNPFHWRIDIVFTKYGIHTLGNIIIANLTWIDLFPRSVITQRSIASNVAQPKEKSYDNRHPIDQFLPLPIEVFGCLHKNVDVFLHNYANAIWSLKGPESPHLSTLVIFLRQNGFIPLQRMQTSFILNRTVVISLVTSRLPPFQDTPPIATIDLL